MVDPIPQNVKDCLKLLPAAQQVILRAYIGTLRANLKEKDGEILGLRDDDPNAHYHGDKMCTADQYVYHINSNFYRALLLQFISLSQSMMTRSMIIESNFCFLISIFS